MTLAEAEQLTGYWNKNPSLVFGNVGMGLGNGATAPPEPRKYTTRADVERLLGVYGKR